MEQQDIETTNHSPILSTIKSDQHQDHFLLQSSRYDLLKYISDAQLYKLKSGRSKEIQILSINHSVNTLNETVTTFSAEACAFFFLSFFHTHLELILARLLVAWALMNDAQSSIFQCCTSMMNWVHLESSLRKNKIDSHRGKKKGRKKKKRPMLGNSYRFNEVRLMDKKKISWRSETANSTEE